MNPANRVFDTVRMHGMISPGDSVLLGVSGGPDSVALLHLLYGLKGRLGCTLTVAHFDHGLRGQEGREDADFVRQMAHELDLPFHLGQRAAGAGGLTGRNSP